MSVADIMVPVLLARATAAEAKVERLRDTLKKIAEYDHQKMAIAALQMPDTDPTKSAIILEAMMSVAATDMQAWAWTALNETKETEE